MIMSRKIRKPKQEKVKLKKIVPDTSAIINGVLSKMMKDGKIKGSEIIIPKIVMGELQAQASRMKESGFLGLEEIKTIRDSGRKYNVSLKLIGERPSYNDIMLAKSGRIDSLIQDVAKKEKATLVTSDLPQALVAEAEGIAVKYFESYKKAKKIRLEKLLTKDTMSIHLKENTIPYAKRGRPGKVEFVKLSKKKMRTKDLEDMIKELMDAARYEEDAFIESGFHNATVIQLRHMRIAITRPPFSDGLELTCVRPVVKLVLDDYKLSEKLKKRLSERAEGILIAGPPGSGKSTFAASLAEFYLKKEKTVKTMESPRDLDVPPEITQYAPLEGSFVKTSDILLLVRPDYTIFDEIRKTKDFQIFSDMRLAGIGMVGVVHATDPVDAVQRFIGRVELGVIPHVIDTIVYIKDGNVKKIYSLSLTVKVPNGMTEADLARPLVEVKDFEDGKVEYEIYTYGEQTVVVPVKEKRKPPIHKLAASRVREEIKKYDSNAEVEFLSDERVLVRVRNDIIPRLIGKEGKTIKRVEDRLGISVEVEPMVESLGKEIDFEVNETGAYIVLYFDKKHSGENANIYVDDEYLFTATIGRSGQIKVGKNSDVGKNVLRSIARKKDMKVFI